MTQASVATARFAEGDFRIGSVLSRAASVLSRNFLTYVIVMAIAYGPTLLLLKGSSTAATDPGQAVLLALLGFVLMMVLGMLGQAVILHAAFQDMRSRPVSLVESLKVGLRRFFPVIAVAFIAALLTVLASLLLIVPGLILFTMWYVGVQVCVVERSGPWASLRRSQELTKGHRWKIFGLLLLLLIISVVISSLLELGLVAAVGSILAFIGYLIWTAIWGAYSSIAAAVAYHDLRVAKEGIDIEQIAAVFD